MLFNGVYHYATRLIPEPIYFYGPQESFYEYNLAEAKEWLGTVTGITGLSMNAKNHYRIGKDIIIEFIVEKYLKNACLYLKFFSRLNYGEWVSQGEYEPACPDTIFSPKEPVFSFELGSNFEEGDYVEFKLEEEKKGLRAVDIKKVQPSDNDENVMKNALEKLKNFFK